jgi:putative transposase
MSRRGDCHDNVVAESFFQLLKRERIRRKIYTVRAKARSDVFGDIECSTTRSAATDTSNNLSPVQFEQRCFLNSRTVWKSRGEPPWV